MSTSLEAPARPGQSRREETPDVYPHVPRWLSLLFYLYVVTWYLQIGSRIAFLGAMRFEFFLGSFLVIAACFVGAELRSSLLVFVAFYLMALFIQLPFSADFDSSWQTFVNRLVKFSMMALFITVFVKNPRHLLLFLGAFLLACMKIGQEGLVGVITGGAMWQNQGVMRLHGSTGLYGHPNSLAGNALGSLPFVFYLFPISNLAGRIALLVQAGLAFNILMFTGSRTGYIGFFGMAGYALCRAHKRFRTLLLIALIVVAAAYLVPGEYIERFHSIFTLQEREGHSAQTRLLILKDGWQIVLRYPMGVGISAFPKVRQEMFGRYQDTHNLYLEVATNLGIQGFVAFFFLVFKMMRHLGQLRAGFADQKADVLAALCRIPAGTDHRRSAESHLLDLRLMEATSAAIRMFIFARLVVGIFGMDLYEIYWWFALGLTLALTNLDRHARKRTSELSLAVPAVSSPE